MSSTASSVQTGGVVIPAYQSATGALVRALEHAASVVAGYSDDDGEQYAMLMVSSVPAAEVPANSVVVIPLDTPQANAVVNFTFLASSKSMFFQVHEKPQTRMTYGHCSNYSAGTVDRPIPIGALVKFPSMGHYLVAQPRLLQAVRESLEPAGGGQMGGESSKRPCLRPLEGGVSRLKTRPIRQKVCPVVVPGPRSRSYRIVLRYTTHRKLQSVV